MTDNLVERIDARAHQGIAATPFNLLMDAKERIEALTAERDSLLSGHRILNIDGARLQDRVEGLEENQRFIIRERDRTFALMLARAERAEAERDARIDPAHVEDLIKAAEPILAEANAALTAERDEWKKRHFKMRDERDTQAIAAKNYADFNHEWRKRADKLEADNARLLEVLKDCAQFTGICGYTARAALNTGKETSHE